MAPSPRQGKVSVSENTFIEELTFTSLQIDMWGLKFATRQISFCLGTRRQAQAELLVFDKTIYGTPKLWYNQHKFPLTTTKL